MNKAKPETWNRVKTAVQYLFDKAPITDLDVAMVANIAPSTIYRDPQLHAYIQDHQMGQRGYYRQGEDIWAREFRKDVVWSCGVLHVDPNAPLTPELLQKKWTELSNTANAGNPEAQSLLKDAYKLLMTQV